jgi:hypothetical protein
MAIRNLGQTVISILRPDGKPTIPEAAQTILNLGSVSNITGLNPARATDRLFNGNSSAIATVW